MHYLQAQSLAQVAVQVAHKEATGRVRTALPTLPCHCHQNGTGSLVERKKFNFIYHIPEMYLQIHCAQICVSLTCYCKKVGWFVIVIAQVRPQ